MRRLLIIMSLKVTDFVKHFNHEHVKVPTFSSENRITLLIGLNGSGKSTLLKSMADLYYYEGDIEKNASMMYTDETMVFPEHMRINDYLNILIDMSKAASKTMKDSLLCLFDLEQHKEKKFKELSKGMKQKVNLIQALMENKDLYLLDEPMSGLDFESQIHFINHLKNSRKQYVIATHKEKTYEPLNAKKVYL